jgi:D-arabinose 1-dehydrogenase-like Zn-dependent alcohol dehydrogenase
MKALVYSQYGELPRVREIANPVCPADGAIIAVRATGVCRSDWHAWRGHDPVALPHVPGHEFAGVIAEIGSKVGSFRVGERVTAPFVEGCGDCEYCLAGNAQVCPRQTQPGFTGPGSFAEQVVINGADVNLVRLPDSVGFVAASALGCRFATAFRAITVHGRIARGQWLAVYGCGGVGLSAVMIGVAVGARVIAIDPHSAALARASELGAEHALSGGAESHHSVHEITDGGAHVTVDAVGSPATAAMALRSLRRRGRHVQVGLLLGDDAMAALPMDRVIAHELEIYGSHGMSATDYPALMGLITSGVLHPERLVGSVIGLDRAGGALAAMDSGTPAGLTVIEI